MQPRSSVSQTFEANIAAKKAKLEAEIASLQPGPEKDELAEKIRQLDTASRISEWLSSPDYHLQANKPPVDLVAAECNGLNRSAKAASVGGLVRRQW